MWASAGEQSPGTPGLDISGQQHPAARLASRSFPGKSVTHPPGVGITGPATWCSVCIMFIDVRANPFCSRPSHPACAWRLHVPPHPPYIHTVSGVTDSV